MSDTNLTVDLCVVIITCNAQRTIKKTLMSVQGLASRVVVVDSGSTDETKSICTELSAEVVDHEWEGYGKQKQFALGLSDSAWMLSLDSDESLDKDLANEIRNVIQKNDPSINGFEMNRRLWFGDKEMCHTWQPEWKTRLVRKDKGRWVGNYHERLEVDGRVGRVEGLLIHDAITDTKDFVIKQAKHGVQAADVYFEQGKRGSFLKLLISPTATVFKHLVIGSAWLDGWRGWIAAFGSGLHATAKHMRLLELTRKSKS